MRTLLSSVVLTVALLLVGAFRPAGDAFPALASDALPLPTSLEAAVFDGISAPDTLRLRVEAGDPLIAPLPDELQGAPVSVYTPLRVPALSWTVDRSFFWNTRERDGGRYELLFLAERTDAPSDTLALVVAVE